MSELVSSILSASSTSVRSPFLQEALVKWSSELPPEDCRHLQNCWDKLLYEHHYSAVLDSAADSKTKAWLLSVASSEAGAWLGALPVSTLRTKLDDESLRIALYYYFNYSYRKRKGISL